MSHWKPALLALTATAALGVGIVALSPLGDSVAKASSSGRGQPAGSKAEANGRREFVVSGQVLGLHPGAVKPLVLTVRNPNSLAIRVTSISVTVGAAGATCPATTVVVPRWSGSLLVPRDGTAAVTLSSRMSASAPDGCQSATYPLSYGGSAVKA